MGILSFLFNPNVKKMHEAGDIHGLIRALSHKNTEVQEKAKEALISLGSSALDPLVDAMIGGSDNVADPLDKLDGAAVVKSLTRILYDEERSLKDRGGAAHALDKRGWEPINDTAKAHYFLAKREWNELIGLGVEIAVPLLVPLLRPKKLADTIFIMVDADIATEATDTLVQIGKPAEEPLIEAL
jgi:HEAT repeat protein